LRQVTIRPAAIEDLDQIFDHTVRHWSEAQALRYANQLENGLNDLAQLSSPGRPCAGLQPGLRRQPIASHVVYFLLSNEGLTVARVLHSRMSPALHKS